MDCGVDSHCNPDKIIYTWEIHSKIFQQLKKFTSVHVEGEW